MKICKTCGTDKTSKWLKGPTCNRCYHKEYRTNNPEQARKSDKIQGLKIIKRYGQVLKRDEKKNFQNTISFEEYKTLLVQSCYYCNNILGEPVLFAIGLDRIDNSKGYELSNVVSCCDFCNRTRGMYLSSDEMKAVANLLVTMRNVD